MLPAQSKSAPPACGTRILPLDVHVAARWLPDAVRLLLILTLGAQVSQAADEAVVRPQIVGHRGLLQHAPENTLTNFRACLELRIGFEFDVRRSRDGQLVCLHDETLNRTTDGSGPVTGLTLAELKKLDAARRFDPAFAGERIPTIDEIFALLAQHPEAEVLLAVDIKAEDLDVEADTVRLAKKHDVLKRLLFIGRPISMPDVRRRLRAADPKAHVAALAGNPAEFDAALTDPLADWVYFRYLPSREEVIKVHESGKKAFIAGVSVAGLEMDNWKKAAKVGLDAVLTDYPLALRQHLQAP